jgi:hypothetical protein
MVERIETLVEGGLDKNDPVVRKDVLEQPFIRRFKEEDRERMFDRALEGFPQSCDRKVTTSSMCGTCYLYFVQADARKDADLRYEGHRKRSKKELSEDELEVRRQKRLAYSRSRTVRRKALNRVTSDMSAAQVARLLQQVEIEHQQSLDAAHSKYGVALTKDGVTKTIAEWASEIGVPPHIIVRRLQVEGLEVDDILSKAKLPTWKVLGLAGRNAGPGNRVVQKMRFILDAQIHEDPEDVEQRIDTLEQKDAREVLKRRFFLEQTQADIAADWGMSRERVRQIEEKALRLLFADYVSFLADDEL